MNGDEWIIPALDPTTCRTYWGSHGCDRDRGHEGDHFCCCECRNHPDPGSGCVGTAPYYGSDTWFFGEDTDEGTL